MFTPQQARDFLEGFIRQEQAMRIKVLRGESRERKIMQCDMALDALDALADEAGIEGQGMLFGERA